MSNIMFITQQMNQSEDGPFSMFTIQVSTAVKLTNVKH